MAETARVSTGWTQRDVYYILFRHKGKVVAFFSTVILTRVGLRVLSVVVLVIAGWHQRTGSRRIDTDRVLVVLPMFGVLSFGNFGAFHGPGSTAST